MSGIFELIKHRRSVRKFNPEPVDKALLEKIIEAGRWAPTGGNTQLVHFTVIQDREVLTRLQNIVKNVFSVMEVTEGMYPSRKKTIINAKKETYHYDYDAPVLVIVSNQKNHPNALVDCACSLQNMMLEATSLGVGSCWINQLHWLDEDAELRGYLASFGIGEDETICGSLAIGNCDKWPATVERKGMKVDWI